VAPPSVDYVRRDPAGSVLQQIVREHFETFRAEAAHLRDGEGLPRFVEEEFKAFLRCGWLGRGTRELFGHFFKRSRDGLLGKTQET
jgi:hypothetical protein